MAISTYLGVDGDWQNNANWSDGAFPGDADTPVFPPVATPKSMTINMDQSAGKFAAIITQPHCNVTIGGPGNPLLCAATKIIHAGDKAFYVKADHATLDIDQIEVNSDNKTLAMEIDDDGTAQVLHIRVLKGAVNTTTTIVALPFIEVGRRTSPDTDAVLNIAAHASNTLDKLIMNSGLVTVTDKELTDAVVAGGLLIVEGGEVVTYLGVAGGTCHYNTTGALARGACSIGLLDFNQNYVGKTVAILSGTRPGKILTNDAVAITSDVTESGVVESGAIGGGSSL